MFYMSQMKLANDNPMINVVRSALNSDDQSERRSAQHNLMWSLFADGNRDRKRDFIYREKDGQFIVYSATKPKQNDYFAPIRTKEANFKINEGDELIFTLEVNATVKKGEHKKKSSHCDVVMDALRDVPTEERSEKRMEVANLVGPQWLARQGSLNGFHILACRADNYRVDRMKRFNRNPNAPHFGVLELTGKLVVTDVAAFKKKLEDGFGRSKAFGCGLMLIKRA